MARQVSAAVGAWWRGGLVVTVVAGAGQGDGGAGRGGVDLDAGEVSIYRLWGVRYLLLVLRLFIDFKMLNFTL